MPSPSLHCHSLYQYSKRLRRHSQHQLLTGLPTLLPACCWLPWMPGSQAPCGSDEAGTMFTLATGEDLANMNPSMRTNLASLSAEELKELERSWTTLNLITVSGGDEAKESDRETPTGTFLQQRRWWPIGEKESQKLLEKERLGECGKVGSWIFFSAIPNPQPRIQESVLFFLIFHSSSLFL